MELQCSKMREYWGKFLKETLIIWLTKCGQLFRIQGKNITVDHPFKNIIKWFKKWTKILPV